MCEIKGAASRMMVDESRTSSLSAVEIDGMTRGAFMMRGVLAAGAAYGAAAAGPFVARSFAQGGESDGDILRLALTLELLEADFYRVAESLPLRADLSRMARDFGRNEQLHVTTIETVLDQQGTSAADERALTFRFNMRTEADFLKVASQLEEVGVAAYNGAAPLIHSPEILSLAGQIVQVEARHAAAIRVAQDKNPSPDAFDKAATLEDTTAAAVPFIKKL